ncbi:hypothetical protein BYT27DRAFT_7220536 [Phlegmacium glaucopus]|nr:hypothetical protein BYT27DRAFT_7220536 [Phlegmacium glaucopus]
MVDFPSISQRPQSFHPDFDREVYAVVEGQGPKVDATRFLHDMLFDGDGILGTTTEGTINNPIIVQGCTVKIFANFLGWLNHNAWAALQASHACQLVDILHVSHMWDIQPGIDFATQQLLKFDLHPAHRLSLARQYNLLDWIPSPVRSLLASPLERYTKDSKDNLDFELYMIIATAKESISMEQKHLGNHPPFPQNFDNDPFCAQHETCKKVWTEKWFFTIVRRIHHPTAPLPLSLGMNLECKCSILTWLQQSFLVKKEENLIQETIMASSTIFLLKTPVQNTTSTCCLLIQT